MAKPDNRQSGALFSIGQTAKLFHMNIRTLRYYDKIGLLKPEYINEETGYRYYSTGQFERLNTIKYLRALDVPIERIATFLDGRDVQLIRAIFEEQLQEVNQKQHELARIEQKIISRIKRIDEAVNAPLGEIEIVELPERHMVMLAENFAPTVDLEPLIRTLSHHTKLDDAIFLGKVGISINRHDLVLHVFDQFTGVFILVEAADQYEGHEAPIPGGTFAQIRYRGMHKDVVPYYEKLVGFIESHGYAICGDSIETTLIDAGMTSDESQYVTELQIPIERADG